MSKSNMELIGMLDSPYVRRVAVSMKVMGLPFVHRPISVFSDYDAFAELNPVVKAPTLVTDDGIVLMESGLILEYLDTLVADELRLFPSQAQEYARAQRIIGLALVACEKTVQIVYERKLRPADKQHQPWIDRVQTQLLSAYRLLEAELGSASPWLFGERPLQADIATAITWRFTAEALPGLIKEDAHPALARFSAYAEEIEAFLAFSP